MFQGKRKKVLTKKKGDGAKKPRKTQNQDKDASPPWRTGLFNPTPLTIAQPAYLPINSNDWTAEQYVQQYFDDNILKQIVEKSNQNYLLKTGKDLKLRLPELKIWLGINFVISALQVPLIRMCWDKKWRIPLVANNMARDRFFLIRNWIKLVFDNEITADERKADRLWKVRPLLNRILEGCLKQNKAQELSIDEMIVPFSGTCGVKQHIPNKPNPTGLKVYVLANPNGIVCDFTVYQGAATYLENPELEQFWQCESAVLQLTRSLVPGHILYADRFFTSVRLADELLKKGFRLTGTIRKDRIPKTADLPSDKEFKKANERGTSLCTVREEKDENGKQIEGKVGITKWLDNNCVSMISTAESIEPTCVVKRWSKASKQFINVSQPKVINAYNAKMGGVDLADRMLSYCSSRARTKKWTVRCILHFFDLSLSNSWLQMRETKQRMQTPAKNIPQFRTFKLQFGELLIERNAANEPITSDDENLEDKVDNPCGDRRVLADPTPEKRIQEAAHLPEVTKGIQKRCAMQKCKKKSTVYCVKCNVYLCLVGGRNCFRKFHSK